MSLSHVDELEYYLHHENLANKRWHILENFDKISNWLNELNEEQVIEALIKASNNAAPEVLNIACVLAFMIKSDRPAFVKAAYAALPNLCNSGEFILDFVYCLKQVWTMKKSKNRKNPEVKITGIWGSGLRKAVCKWYSLKDCKTLSLIFISNQRNYNWSHKDIMHLIHFKPSTPEMEAVVNYFVFGKKGAHEKLPEECQEIVKKASELKTCTDPSRIVTLLTELNMKLTPSGPANVLKLPEVWAEYIKQMPVKTLLGYLEYFTSIKARANIVLPAAISIINNCSDTKIDPITVYSHLYKYAECNYRRRKTQAIESSVTEEMLKKIKSDLAALEKKLSSVKIDDKPSKKEEKSKYLRYEACESVLNALTNLLSRSLKALPKKNDCWLLILDLQGGPESRASTFLPVGAIGAAIAMYAGAVGRTLTIVANGVGYMDLDTSSYEDTTSKLIKLKTAEMEQDALLTWGLTQKSQATKIVLLSDCQSFEDGSISKLQVVFANHKKKTPKKSPKLLVLYPKGVKLAAPKEDDMWISNNFKFVLLGQMKESV